MTIPPNIRRLISRLGHYAESRNERPYIAAALRGIIVDLRSGKLTARRASLLAAKLMTDRK